MLADVQMAALIIAGVLIVVGAVMELRAEVAEARRNSAGFLEWTWIILPVIFLGVLVVLSARAGG
jgi:heme/copper-type cytochrome/quinol oxidase subunit 2